MRLLRTLPRRYTYLLPTPVLIAFAAWWMWSTHLNRPAANQLRVLCAEEWIDPSVVDAFARAHDARVALYTYREVREFLRQLANADGRVDVICTSSLLLRDLVRSHWIRRTDFAALAARRGLAADFLHLPFDPNLNFGVPANWSTYGVLSTRGATDGLIKTLQSRGRVGVWASDLNLMALLTLAGVAFEDRLESEAVARLEDEVHRFVSSLGLIPPDVRHAQPAEWARRYDFAHVPSTTLGAEGRFTPGDLGVVDVGVLAIGERAGSPELAFQLIDHLSEARVAGAAAERLGLGTVHDDTSAPAGRRPSALRGFELTRLRFPDVNAEATLKFARDFANQRAARR